MKWRALLLTCMSLALTRCSFQSYLIVINPHNETRQVTIVLESRPQGVPIFRAKHFALYPLKDNEVDFSSHVPVARADASSHTLPIPAKTALCIALLHNETFNGSDQHFINGRVFNLKQLVAGEIVVSAQNFGSYFKKTNYGAAWLLP